MSEVTWDRAELIEMCSKSSLLSSIGSRSLETSWATVEACNALVEAESDGLGGSDQHAMAEESSGWVDPVPANISPRCRGAS